MLICHLCSSIESKLSLCIQMAHCGMNGSADAQKVTINMYSRYNAVTLAIGADRKFC